jgi:hypothetical protein
VIKYTIVVFLIVLPAIVLGVWGLMPWWLTLVIAGIGCRVIPALLYRRTWSWWLMLYFFFQPQALPANGGPTREEED